MFCIVYIVPVPLSPIGNTRPWLMATILVSDFFVYTFQPAINLPYKMNYLYCENLIIIFTRVYIVAAKFDKIGFIAPHRMYSTTQNVTEVN